MTTSRSIFQRMARQRIFEAEILFQAKCYDGVYYLAGYAVECALKAAISKNFQRHVLPDKAFVNKVFVHDLEELLVHSGLKSDHQAQCKASPAFNANWATIKSWSEMSRYRTNTKVDAIDLIRAVSTAPADFMTWVITRW